MELAYSSLKENDLDSFLRLINESGLSSSNLLCNTQVPGRYMESPERALEIARKVATNSAHRVHGGGFMGTIISFVRSEDYDNLINAMKDNLGISSVTEVEISAKGAGKI